VTRPDFPAVLDSTILGTFRSCPRKMELAYLHHWKPRVESVHLVAGAAFAAGLEEARRAYYERGATPGDALALGVGALLQAYGTFECPPDSAKSPERMSAALEYYFDAWPLGADRALPITLGDGRRGIEVSFAEPLDVAHPVTGDPLLYCGRFDQIVEFEGLTLGEDDKTTGSLGASWALQWDLRSQFTSYCWGARQMGIKLDGFLVRGVAILKTKFNHEQALTHRPTWMIDRWYEQTLRDIRRMIYAWEEGYFDYNLDHACTEYSGCMLRNVCLMKEPAQLLAMQFERKHWDPLTRTELPVEGL